MTGDEHTIDLTGGGALGASVNGNGHVRNGRAGGNGQVNGSGNGIHPAPEADVLPDAAPLDVGHPDVERPVTARGELDGIDWFPSYDRDSVERHLRALDAERDRLTAEISAAERRTAEAEANLAARTAALEAGLGAVVVAARTELARIERERDDAVAAIRADAEAEATRIREAARAEAATVRGATGSLTPTPDAGGTGAD